MSNEQGMNLVTTQHLELLATLNRLYVEENYVPLQIATISIDTDAVELETTTAAATVTVTTDSDGDIIATPDDPLICSTTVSGNTVTITPASNRGEAVVYIHTARTAVFTASEPVAVNVTVTANLPTDMLKNRTLAEVQAIFQSGEGAQYFKAGDYFDITFQTTVNLYVKGADNLTTDDNTKIYAGSTWRCVLLGIDHNSTYECSNRGHFMIGKSTNNVSIGFQGYIWNTSNSNSGGWNSSKIKSWLNSTFYNALPSDLTDVICDSVKYTNNASNNSASAVTATTQKLWLMSEFEVAGARNGANQYEQNYQAQYAYFANGNTKLCRYHFNETTEGEWWTRSPRANEASICVVHPSGVVGNGVLPWRYASSNKIGARMVVACFCIG